MLNFLIYLLLTLPLIGAYAMLAIGIVVIFRASRVLNLAHGAMAMAPAYLVYTLHQHHLPTLVALPVGVAFGALLGAATERVFVRPLRRQGPTAQTVGTVAVFGLTVALIAKIYGTTPLLGVTIFPAGGPRLSGSLLSYGSLGLFATAIAATIGFLALFRFTGLGLSLRGAADNRTAAALVGINPDRSAVVAWLLGGGLAGLAGILLGGVTQLSPYSLALQELPAFVAALIGGLGSLTGALVGAALVGSLTGLVPAFGLLSFTRVISGQTGMPQLILTIVALVVMFLRGGRYSSSEVRAEIGAGGGAPIRQRFRPTTPMAMRRIGPVRVRTLRYVVLVMLLAWPFLNPPFSLLGDAIQAGLFVIAASSIVLLTGWVGQISLAQAAFVGIGAFGSANLIRAWHLPFPFSLIAAGGIAAGAALILGLVALRVRGLYLAVTTLIFAYMCDAYLFVAPYFAGSGGVSSAPQPSVGHANVFPYFDLSDRRTFYFIIVAVAATMLFALSNLRDSKTGRAFFALRGSEMAAASLGIDVTRYKLIAFAVAGGIAGVAGNLLLVGQGSVVSAQFGINVGLLYLAIAVVGGLESLGGLVVSALIFAALNELFFRVVALTGYLDIVSAGLLTVVLLVYPGGLAAVPQALSGRLLQLREAWERLNRQRTTETEGARSVAWRARRSSAARTNFAVPTPVPLATQRPAPAVEEVPVPYPADEPTVAGTGRLDFSRLGDNPGITESLVPFGEPLLEARNVRVEFQGLVAVANASLRLDQGQIVGLIGPNGAGKTTLFNAISGLVTPTSGSVHLFGDDVTDRPVHERARRGLGRTFQAIQLFSQLSVYENLLVATHTNNPCRLIDNVALTRRGLRYEAAAADAVRRVIHFMGLTDVADRTVSGLPFGILRQVEIARTLVTGSPIVMLDEPASGLDNAETDRLSELLLGLREGLGLTLLLIEHDVRMVTEVSDYMYVLVHGEIISDGTPSAVRADPDVIAAYLGDSGAHAAEAVSA